MDFIWLDVLNATGSPNFQPSCDFSEWMTGKCWRKTRYFGSICKGASFNFADMQCFHDNSWILQNRKTSVFSRFLLQTLLRDMTAALAVIFTSTSLTEGRSAWDIPKQHRGKKICFRGLNTLTVLSLQWCGVQWPWHHIQRSPFET